MGAHVVPVGTWNSQPASSTRTMVEPRFIYPRPVVPELLRTQFFVTLFGIDGASAAGSSRSVADVYRHFRINGPCKRCLLESYGPEAVATIEQVAADGRLKAAA